MSDDFQIRPAGDSAFLIQFADRIDSQINARAIDLAERVRSLSWHGVLDVVPTFRSVAIYFNPLETHQERLLAELRTLAQSNVASDAAERPLIRIPVEYGGAFGPDLADVARFANATEQEVIQRHSAVVYRVFMLGFVPGFAYMGTVDPRIATPRRQTPRTAVPAGSVGIAGMQTGIYPSEIPGGWQLIGRTAIRPFDLSRADASLFKPGDAVQFVPLDH